MLQINNILRAVTEAKHSLKEIMKSAMDYQQCRFGNIDKNNCCSKEFGAGFQGYKARWRD
jgi:hypothetical protein